MRLQCGRTRVLLPQKKVRICRVSRLVLTYGAWDNKNGREKRLRRFARPDRTPSLKGVRLVLHSMQSQPGRAVPVAMSSLSWRTR